MIVTRRKQTVCNLVIFAVVSVGIGWIGLWLNRVMAEEAPGQDLGMLLWRSCPRLQACCCALRPATDGQMPGCVLR